MVSGPILGKISRAHVSLEWKINIKKVQPKTFFSSLKYKYKWGDYEKMNVFLNTIDWDGQRKNTVQEQYNHFTRTIPTANTR